MKQAFIFWRRVSEVKPTEPAKNEITADSAAAESKTTGATGTEIIDISKYQGNIDFAKLAKKVALVIARVSCGSDKDIRFDEYAKAMNEHKIPFGVYCYTYAGDKAKAEDEAQKMIAYASAYKPLFYVMDAEEDRITNASIKAFAKELKAQGAPKIGCYVAHNHYKAYDYDSVRNKFDFTWIPRYGSNNGTVAGSIKPSYTCDLWQYTSVGKISGISGNVDMNKITGEGHTLSWFLGGEDGTEIPVARTEAKEETKEAASEADRKVAITGIHVNVRTEASTKGSVLGQVNTGDKLVYGGSTASNGWLSVVYNGSIGWVSGTYGKLV